MHKYLGMTIDYSSPGKVILLIINHIRKMIVNITEDMKEESATPDAHHLFEISEDTTKLSQSEAYIFQHFLAELLQLSKKVRP